MISLTFFLSFMLHISFSFLSSHSKVADKPLVTSLGTLCLSTLYPKTCYDTLPKSPLINPKQKYQPSFFYNQSVYASIAEVSRVSKRFDEDGSLSQTIKGTNEKILHSALESCRDSLSLALYNLKWSIPNHDNKDVSSQEARSWLSAARAHLQTCSHGFEYASNDIQNVVTAILDNPTKVVITSLAILSKIDEMMSLDDEPGIDTSGELTKYKWESIWSSSEGKNRPRHQSKAVDPSVVVVEDGSV